MTHKTTIIADTINKNDVAAQVEITVDDGAVIDIVIDCPEDLTNSDKAFFAWEAIDEMEEYPEIYMPDFFS